MEAAVSSIDKIFLRSQTEGKASGDEARGLEITYKISEKFSSWILSMSDQLLTTSVY
jgi:hypothetical protein